MSSSPHHSLVPVLVKHPRCRPFFRVGSYGVVAGRTDNIGKVFDRDDVEVLGGDAHRVHLAARENLRALFESGAMTIRTGRTSDGHSYLVIEHPTLASSCLFLPGLAQSAAAFLGGSRFACLILKRNLIAVFPDFVSRLTVDVARSIARVLLPTGSALDFDLFALDELHPRPITMTMKAAAPPPPPPKPARYQSGLYEKVDAGERKRPRIRLRAANDDGPPTVRATSAF